MDKKFEDKLKERLQFEEHDFDHAAWEKYQENYIDKKKRFSFFKSNKKLLFILIFLSVGLFAGWNVFYKNTDFKQQEIIENSLQGNLNNAGLSELETSRKDYKSFVKGEEDTEIITGDSQSFHQSKSTTIQKLLNRKNTKEENSNALVIKKQSDSDKKNMAHKEGFGSPLESRGNNLISMSKTAQASVAFSRKNTEENILDGRSKEEIKLNQELSNRNDGSVTAEQKEKLDNEFTSQENSNSLNQRVSNPLNDEGVSETVTPPHVLGLESIPSLDFSLMTDMKPFQIKDNFIAVFKERRLSFFIGAGYVTSAHKREGVNELYPYEPSVIKLGVNYKLDKRFTLSVELNINYQQYLNMSKEVNYYNQTATNFWFYEATINHRSHTNLELPVILKYKLEGSKVNLYAGISIARLLHRQVTQSRNTNLTQTQLEDLGLSQNFDNYINPFNGSLIVGIELPIFKWLSINARVNKGIFDISNDTFWESGNSYNDFFTFSTHINF